MSVTYGANPTELTSLGDKLLAQNEAITEILGVGSLVESTAWVGPAREAFVSQWNTSFKTALTNLQASFEAASTECKTRATNLEAAMGNPTVTSASPGGGTTYM